MDIKTFRAKTMRDALELVHRELGPSAAVLHTREVNSGPIGRLVFGRKFEVAASTAVNVPSRLPAEVSGVQCQVSELRHPIPDTRHLATEPAYQTDYRAKYREDFRRQVAGQIDELHAMVEKLCEGAATAPMHDLPEAVFRAFTDLIEAEVDEAIVREWIDEIRTEADDRLIGDAGLVKSRVAELLEDEIKVYGPIKTEANKCRVVALVGPTGVGKTTTIAKLAANYRLREKRRVGLITVDTYRVAAVEQLRTYADIIDLPMEVVATPREMREAVARMSHLDLVLMDTAGRSPRDEVKIQELKSMLLEAEPDEVHLVLSSTAGAKSLISTAEKFADVGTTALLLTKLDEAHSLGHLVSLVRECQLPVSYLTDGQNVPDDIQIAEKAAMAEMLLGVKV
jgi:flagellar biosynthesis protein FlhF